MRHLIFFFLSIFTFFSIGCGGNLIGLAESMLYPFESVDKKYPVPENPPAGLSQVYLDTVDTEGNTIKVHAWYHRSTNQSTRALVYFHGNGTNLEALSQSNFIGVLDELDFNFIILDYPGLGRSEGTPNQPNLVNAGIATVNYAKSIFPRAPLIIWGRSLGAAVATQVSGTHQHLTAGLVLTSPWSSFLALALEKTGLAKKLPAEWLALHSYNSVEAAAGINIRTMIHHGNADTLIPFKFGKKLSESFTSNNNVNFIELDGIGHNDVYTSSEFWQDLRAF